MVKILITQKQQAHVALTARDSMPSTKVSGLPKNPIRNQVKQSPNITRATLQQLKELTYLSQDSNILQEVTLS